MKSFNVELSVAVLAHVVIITLLMFDYTLITDSIFLNTQRNCDR